MITGFNTDVEHDGVVYHVQTEDKGLDSPVILSLVYSGGAILASKRAPYSDLVASGFSEEVLAERLKRQHRLICAAIHSGRIEDLKRMGSHSVATPPPAMVEIDYGLEPEYQPAPEEVKPRAAPPSEEEFDPEVTLISSPAPPPLDTEIGEPTQSPLGEIPAADQGLVVTLLDEREFRSGQSLTVRVLVTQKVGEGEKPLNNVAVSLKVLGTTFRPQIYSTKTAKNGIATVDARIPEFTSGRAAILVRAVAHGLSTEIRRIVHSGK